MVVKVNLEKNDFIIQMSILFPQSSFEIMDVDNFKLFNIFSSYCFMLSYLTIVFKELANVMYSYNFRQNDSQIWFCGIIIFLQSHNEVQRILEID